MILDRRVASALLLLIACSSRQHLWEARGRAYQENLALQAPPPPPGAKAAKAAPGLDSQEASIIAASYRHSLAPKEEKVNEQPLMIVSPQTGQAGYALPPPSVPKE